VKVFVDDAVMLMKMRVHHAVVTSLRMILFRVTVLRRIAMREPLRHPGQVQNAQQDQHQPTAISMMRPMRVDDDVERIMAAPTQKMVMVWPTPTARRSLPPAEYFAVG